MKGAEASVKLATFEVALVMFEVSFQVKGY